ncbi:MAG: aminopeptidase [Candidatus Nanohaloarchaea archaeon]
MRTTEDPRIKEWARLLVERGAEVSEGDNVYLLALPSDSIDLFREVRRQVIEKGGRPHEHFLFDSQLRSGSDYEWLENADMDQLSSLSGAKLKEMEEMDSYIRIGPGDNLNDTAGVEEQKVSRWQETSRPLFHERLRKNWVTTRYPTDGLAQNTGMSTSEFEDMLLSAINTDYDEIHARNQEIKQEIDQADEIRIKSGNTDLRFSIKGREAVNCHGKRNIPDGEIFYAPVRDSVEGHIEFEHPGVEGGNSVPGIRLEFEDGRVSGFRAERNEEFLESMIDSDEGSRYIGEFGIGTNTELEQVTGNALLDEKIHGTVHIALGNAYDISLPEGVDGNKSGIHWDLIKDLRPEHGGGKIIADGEVVQEDGEWVF